MYKEEISENREEVRRERDIYEATEEKIFFCFEFLWLTPSREFRGCFSYLQIQRKRHLGNDVVNVIFLDGDVRFTPESIKTQFIRMFVCVVLRKH